MFWKRKNSTRDVKYNAKGAYFCVISISINYSLIKEQINIPGTLICETVLAEAAVSLALRVGLDGDREGGEKRGSGDGAFTVGEATSRGYSIPRERRKCSSMGSDAAESKIKMIYL